MNHWLLLGWMDDNLPMAPSPPAPDPNHRMMASQWWRQDPGGPAPAWQATAGGTSIRKGDSKGADRILFGCIHRDDGFPEEEATMKITFQKVDESNGVVSGGSPLSSKDTRYLRDEGMRQEPAAESNEGWNAFLPPGDFLVWLPLRTFVAQNVGLYTVAIDFHGPGGQSNYYLDPLLRIDPPAK